MTANRFRRQPHRHLRAVQMIEFTLVFPLLLIFLVFTLDMGMAVLRYAGLQDAAYSAARASAQAGGANIGTPTMVQRSLESALGNIPGYAHLTLVGLSPGTAPEVGQVGYEVVTGDKCVVSGPDSFVTVDVATTPKMITPGVASVLNLLSPQESNGSWTMHARAVARCEVVLP